MCRFVGWIATLISSIGAINWGLEEFFNFNLVDYVAEYGAGVPHLGKIIYGVVALAGVVAFLSLFLCCKHGGCKCEPCKK